MKNYQPYFGVHLEKVVEREKTDIPTFVTKAINYLENYRTVPIFSDRPSKFRGIVQIEWKSSSGDHAEDADR